MHSDGVMDKSGHSDTHHRITLSHSMGGNHSEIFNSDSWAKFRVEVSWILVLSNFRLDACNDLAQDLEFPLPANTSPSNPPFMLHI